MFCRLLPTLPPEAVPENSLGLGTNFAIRIRHLGGLGYKFLVVLVRKILREAQKVRVFTEHLHYFQSNLV